MNFLSSISIQGTLCGGGEPGWDDGGGIEGDAAGAEGVGGEGDDGGDSTGEGTGPRQVVVREREREGEGEGERKLC